MKRLLCLMGFIALCTSVGACDAKGVDTNVAVESTSSHSASDHEATPAKNDSESEEVKESETSEETVSSETEKKSKIDWSHNLNHLKAFNQNLANVNDSFDYYFLDYDVDDPSRGYAYESPNGSKGAPLVVRGNVKEVRDGVASHKEVVIEVSSVVRKASDFEFEVPADKRLVLIVPEEESSKLSKGLYAFHLVPSVIDAGQGKFQLLSNSVEKSARSVSVTPTR